MLDQVFGGQDSGDSFPIRFHKYRSFGPKLGLTLNPLQR